MADNYIGAYSAKRISELAPAANVASADMLVLNQFSSATGFTLTKKASAKALADFVLATISSDLLSGLKQLAGWDLSDLLNQLMLANPADISTVVPGKYSLALSSEDDLKLGTLARREMSDLGLSDYAKKADLNASLAAERGEYVVGVHQTNGLVDYVDTEALSDMLPVDTELDASSTNPVENRVVCLALDQKMDRSSGNASYTAPVDHYIAGVEQKNGKIEAVEFRSLPERQAIDSVVANSPNPPSGAAVLAALEKLETRIAVLEATVAKMQTEYLKLDSSSNQIVYGPVRFTKKVQGSITNADLAVRAKWS